MKKYFPLKKINFTNKLVLILSICIFSCFYIFHLQKGGSVFILGFTFILFIVIILKDHCVIRLRIDNFQYLVLLFVFFSLCSSLWAVRPDKTLSQSFTILQTIICLTLIYSYYSHHDSWTKVFKIVMYGGLFVSLFTIYDLGLSELIFLIMHGTRLTVKFANINGLGMVAAYSSIIVIYYLVYKHIFRYLIFLVPNFMIIVSSGSRKAILVFLIGCFSMFLLKSMRNNILITFGKWVLLVVISVISLNFILSLPGLEMVKERLDGMLALLSNDGPVDSSSLARLNMIEEGVTLFFRSPFLGVGMGSSGYALGFDWYLHNNFVEILSGGGLIGFVIFYSIYFYNFYIFFKFRDKVKDEFQLVFVFMVIVLFMDIGQVSYTIKETYFFFMMFFLASNQLKNQVNGV